MSDVEGNVTVAAGDKVSFQMATMARSGNLVARTIRLENPAAPVKYQGVVNSIQEDKSFGFIERADVVREIFFRNTDLEVGENIDLGDNVEFTIQTRNGKEVATNIIKLVAGTVVFEDVGTEYFRGQVLKPIDRNFRAVAEGDALSGRVKYRGQDRSEKEVQFGETDQVGDFTLKHGDWIKFVIAVDRRDKHPRATKIELLDESFKVSDERREQGTINNTKEGFGFIQCADRDAKIFFHFSECLDVSRQPREGDDCEFTVADDPNHAGQLMATRIKLLAPGTVQFSVTIHPDAVGKVEIEPTKTSWTKNGSNSGSSSPAKEGVGKIIYELNGLNLEIPLHANDCDLRDFPRKGDIVRFDINQLKSTKETNAINIRIIETQHPRDALIPTSAGTGHVLSKPSDFMSLTSATPSAGSSDLDSPASVSGTDKSSSGDHGETVQQGYIAALKDGFGFIETISHDKEIFFHFSNVESKPERLEVGLEVEYTVFNRDKGGKVSAENVKLLRKGTIPPIPGKEEVLHGKVVRPLRSVNPDQNDYCGLIQVKNEDGSVLIDYRFGIASLSNKKELLQVNDPVQFNADLNEEFAMNIHATREKLRAMVEAMKGQYGFLSYEVDEGRKLFFHTSEVESNESLSEGDEVEFVVITNKRTGKHSACCVRKLSSSKRPERLISKLKAMNLEDAARSGRKIVVLRQPKGPDGSKGFAAKRAYL
jgi:cold shock CspA family protein